jgi:hypothetical protein
MTPTIITRSGAGLPALPNLEHVSTHPGMMIHCSGGRSRTTDTAKGIARVGIIQHFHTAPPRWIEKDGRRVNVGGNGWKYGGYGFVVLPEGSIVEMRGWGIRGAHAGKGKGFNRWIGVVLLGRGEDMTSAEQDSILALHEMLIERGGGADVLPHNAVSTKRCPGRVPTQWVLDTFGQPRAA